MKIQIQIPRGDVYEEKIQFREGTFYRKKFREGTNSNSARGRL